MADKFICTRCKNEFVTDSIYVYRRGVDAWDKVCSACNVAIWNSPIQFFFHWGIPDWVEPHMKSPRVLERLQQWFRDGHFCVVHFFSRDEAHTIGWQYKWGEWEREKPPRKPFSYRGWCGGGRIVVIVDNHGIETPESIEWITYHELGHHECQSAARMADNAWYKENKNEGRDGYEWEDDAGHEADSEERHVNRMATAFMDGKEYARPWWRKRVNAFLAGEKEFPNEHAAKPEPSKFHGICADKNCKCKKIEKQKKKPTKTRAAKNRRK